MIKCINSNRPQHFLYNVGLIQQINHGHDNLKNHLCCICFYHLTGLITQLIKIERSAEKRMRYILSSHFNEAQAENLREPQIAINWRG